MIRRLIWLAALNAAVLLPATRILVTVVDTKTYKAVTDLKAGDLTVLDGDRPREIESIEYASTPVDVMLVVDSSLAGNMVQPVAADMISQLREKEQMALVAYDSSAALLQDFTSSRNALLEALSGMKFGNNPQVLDALYAGIDEGFKNATLRRVVLLLTSGLEGYSKVSERTVVQLARKNGVSIYTLYALGYERGLFEALARQTGGAVLSIRELGRQTKSPAAGVFEIVRGSYTVTLRGNLALGEKTKVQIRRQGKYFISMLPLD